MAGYYVVHVYAISPLLHTPQLAFVRHTLQHIVDYRRDTHALSRQFPPPRHYAEWSTSFSPLISRFATPLLPGRKRPLPLSVLLHARPMFSSPLSPPRLFVVTITVLSHYYHTSRDTPSYAARHAIVRPSRHATLPWAGCGQGGPAPPRHAVEGYFCHSPRATYRSSPHMPSPGLPAAGLYQAGLH